MIGFANEPLLHWLVALLPVAGLAGMTARHIRRGRPGDHHGLAAILERLASSLRDTWGMPAWSVASIWLGVVSLLVAGIGLYWDISWHIDLGRDRALFTVPHVMVLTGLFGELLSGIIAIVLATHERAPLGWRWGRLRLPRGGVCLVVFGGCAFLGFPLDDLWHRTYGIDVTLWGPTHEQMILGGALAGLAIWLLYAEAGQEPKGRWRQATMRRNCAGVLLLALSVQQLEFDTGVPQWQALFQPVLIALTASLCMVAARAAFGRGWALAIAAGFVISRLAVAGLVGGVLGLTAAHFPLYLGCALGVEASFAIAEQRRWRPLTTALVAGAAVGTVGLAVEWGWSHVFGKEPWHLSLLPGMWVAVLIAVAGAVVGMALGRLSRRRSPGFPGIVTIAAVAATVGLLAVPLPREAAGVAAIMRLTPTGPPAGFFVTEWRMNLELDLTPATGADNADLFEVLSWQGGSLSSTPLVEVGPGVWRSAGPVSIPTRGKTMVLLDRGPIVAAAPVSFPADPEFGLGPIIPRPVRQVDFAPASQLLLREVHGGAAAVAVLAYAAFVGMALAWLALLLVAFRGLAPSHPRAGSRDARPQPALSAAASPAP